ncbi:MAG: 3-methyl-2-oxobutanoate hydroxymethyltransferase [Gemmataceae bacterium]
MSGTTGPKRVTVPDFRAAKGTRRLSVLTAYDYSAARWLDLAGVDALLVGDSLGMVVQGQSNPLPVTMREILYHTQAVVRGTQRALVIADMPFLSYQVTVPEAVRNAGRLLKFGGASAVKLEGGVAMADTIAACVQVGIPVMGHVGLTPQSVHAMGGFRMQRNAAQIVADARAVEAAGAFAIVLEGMPAAIAAEVTAALTIPTIGIGAGPQCDGQVLVFHDAFGLYPDFRPKFVKVYAQLGVALQQAAEAYVKDVQAGTFPGPEQTAV